MNPISRDMSNTLETSPARRAADCAGCPRAACGLRMNPKTEVDREADIPVCRTSVFGMNRRRFLGASAAFGGWLLGGNSVGSLLAAEPSAMPSLTAPKVKIYTVYLGGAGAWPKPEFDASGEKAKFEKFIAGLMPKFPEVELVGGDLVVSAREALPKIAARDDVAGVLCIHL
ncbi:MAG: twin-arginine translocation signal domain-containing protein, partial [Verrucomicrobia bacterium]|nr:twin-arginine translocation signal domain-containing protein [Verrucomicrobiota bacterium]